jgi:hypothetical protein
MPCACHDKGRSLSGGTGSQPRDQAFHTATGSGTVGMSGSPRNFSPEPPRGQSSAPFNFCLPQLMPASPPARSLRRLWTFFRGRNPAPGIQRALMGIFTCRMAGAGLSASQAAPSPLIARRRVFQILARFGRGCPPKFGSPHTHSASPSPPFPPTTPTVPQKARTLGGDPGVPVDGRLCIPDAAKLVPGNRDWRTPSFRGIVHRSYLTPLPADSYSGFSVRTRIRPRMG